MTSEYSPSASSIEREVAEFLATAGSENVTSLYDIVLAEVDGAVLRATMDFCEGNQSKTTDILGMSRTTLRKKLTEHNLLYHGKQDSNSNELAPPPTEVDPGFRTR